MQRFSMQNMQKKTAIYLNLNVLKCKLGYFTTFAIAWHISGTSQYLLPYAKYDLNTFPK